MDRPFNFGEAPLVKKTEQTIVNAFDRKDSEQQEAQLEQRGEITNVPVQPTEAPVQEKTKGVQAYIPKSMYKRLADIKEDREQTIGSLLIEAIALWLDVQEGKVEIKK